MHYLTVSNNIKIQVISHNSDYFIYSKFLPARKDTGSLLETRQKSLELHGAKINVDWIVQIPARVYIRPF